ncbi:MAG TPA: GNAT family N-acetyltransferase [Candidatus Tyrphobacter sp.]
MPTISTPRLRLVPVDRSNAPALWRMMQRAELRTYQDLPTMDCAQFVALMASRGAHFEPGRSGRYEWLVERSDDGVAVGWVSLRVGERSGDSGEIGYSLLAEHRGKGFATEAVSALIDAAFAQGKLRSVRAYCLPENQASRELLRRLGFREDGVLKHGASLRGRAVDVISHALEASPG